MSEEDRRRFSEMLIDSISNETYIIPIVSNNEDPIVPFFIKILSFKEVKLYIGVLDSFDLFFKKMYVFYAFQAILDYFDEGKDAYFQLVLEKLTPIRDKFKDEYYECRAEFIDRSQYVELYEKCMANKLKIKTNVSKIETNSGTDKILEETLNKIKFRVHIVVALGILGTTVAVTLAILSLQKVIELSLKSAAFLVPTIISGVVLLIATYYEFLLNKAQKILIRGPEFTGPIEKI
ncbi:MAG: hypothetical protein LBJ93_02770 [Clostridiales bacterium]|jgi:ABC-type sugar transport system permease subunit|nr:hypothetical protein [Clostridiales bacterium]